MAEERFDDRTEPATPRRRQEARERGHVARSPDLTSAVVLLAALLALQFFGRQYIHGIFAALRGTLENLHHFSLDSETLVSDIGFAVWAALAGMLPFVLMVFAAALGINLLQVGFLFATEPLAPNLDRLDPVEGMKRIFSLRGVVRLLAGLLKLLIVTAVLVFTIWAERENLIVLLDRAFGEIVQYALEVTFVLALRATLALLILAILDFGYQRWQYDQDLRMSRSEIREELKRFEGDPKIRERRRVLQRQIALQRMMARVPRATVVITNPTEYAVALEYDRDKMEAPTLVAKGADFLAQRIREVAAEHHVPIVQRPEVARAIYRSCEIGQMIPYDLYQAVAEILAYVYGLRRAVA